jgi:uncharacterized membrane protein
MTRKILRIIVAVLAIQVGLYPAIYFIIDRKFGLLHSKSDAVLNDLFWNIGFYTHITMGGLALLIGWIQFNKKIREKRIRFHRRIGKVYVTASLLGAVTAVYIACNATGGLIASLGFICLGTIWFYSTLGAYFAIRNKQVDKHQKRMLFSYAACFSAVTLRIYLPLLTLLFHDFTRAYLAVAWLCWIPNIIVAYFLAKRIQNRPLANFQSG